LFRIVLLLKNRLSIRLVIITRILTESDLKISIGPQE